MISKVLGFGSTALLSVGFLSTGEGTTFTPTEPWKILSPDGVLAADTPEILQVEACMELPGPPPNPNTAFCASLEKGLFLSYPCNSTGLATWPQALATCDGRGYDWRVWGFSCTGKAWGTAAVEPHVEYRQTGNAEPHRWFGGCILPKDGTLSVEYYDDEFYSLQKNEVGESAWIDMDAIDNVNRQNGLYLALLIGCVVAQSGDPCDGNP